MRPCGFRDARRMKRNRHIPSLTLRTSKHAVKSISVAWEIRSQLLDHQSVIDLSTVSAIEIVAIHGAGIAAFMQLADGVENDRFFLPALCIKSTNKTKAETPGFPVVSGT